MRVARSLLVVTAVGAAVAMTTTAATASARPASKVPPVQRNGVAAGYVVATAHFSNPNGAQTAGTATCPGGHVAISGGGFGESSSLQQNINSSIPVGTNAWLVDMNNATGFDSGFTVYAVCVKKATSRTVVVGSPVTNAAGAQTRATATCPTGLVPLGGGGFSDSGSTSVNMNSTFPAGKTGWNVDENNATAGSQTITAYVVCAKKFKNYKIVNSGPQPNNAGTQTLAVEQCPFLTAPVGGGVLSDSGSTLVNVNSTLPDGYNWDSYENNATASNQTMTVYAVCGASTS